MKYYAGIGSRKTPKGIQDMMTKIGKKLGNDGWTLRSGGAQGADTAFYQGWQQQKQTGAEIFIPWNNFEGLYETSPGCILTNENFDRCLEIAAAIHPSWGDCSEGAKKLHARNVYQVLGTDLNSPCKMLICWAPKDGKGNPTGGTRTAWMLAKHYGVQCFNLATVKDFTRIYEYIK